MMDDMRTENERRKDEEATHNKKKKNQNTRPRDAGASALVLRMGTDVLVYSHTKSSAPIKQSVLN